MDSNTISPVFSLNLQTFASANTKFKLFLSDINLDNPTKYDVEKIFSTLSNAILDPALTIHLADIFKNDLLKILYVLVNNENRTLTEEIHLRVCRALSTVVNIHPDASSVVIDYFEKSSAPFVQMISKSDVPVKKKRKMNTAEESLIPDIDIINMSYIFLKSSPNYFRNKWPWDEFIRKYFNHPDYMVRWICCQCIAIITAMNSHQLYALLNNVLPEGIVDDTCIKFETYSRKVLKDISSVDIPIELDSEKNLSINDNTVSIGGINIPVYKPGIEARIKVVEVESTKNNLRKIAMGILSDKAINLIGPVGSGKSILVEYIAEKTGRVLGEQFIKIQLGDQTDSKMLLGTYRCTDIPGEFVWQPGILTQAVMNGNWLLLEDIDSASTDIASVLCGLLENQHLSVPGYRDAVPIKPGFQIFVTQRLLPTMTGYHKRRSQSCDILAKHLLHINIEPLSNSELHEVITTLFPTLKTITNRIVSVFQEFTKERDESSMHKSGRLISTRDLFKWCSRAIIDYDVSSNTSALKILQDGIDIFCCSQRDKETRLNLAKVISSHLGIVQENAIYFCTQYKPNLSLTPDILRAGRATIKRSNKISDCNVKFCFTRPSSCLVENIMCCIATNEPVLLVGETGTGKTSTVQFLAKTLGQELIVINMNQQSDSADLLGGFKPVDLKLVVGPIKKEFEEIFRSFYNVERNKTFLGHIAYCYNSKLYIELLLLMKKSYEAAMKRLTNQSETTIVVGEKRKKQTHKDVVQLTLNQDFLNKWQNFGRKLEKLELQLKHKNALAFTFIEGSLVKAVEKGQWVLLDEINLANAETLECLSSLLEGLHGSLNLLERGDKKPIRRHSNFTLFACMNPSTDVGKKDLPSGLRNRFTEFFVDELTDKTDLLLLANSYLEAKSMKEGKIENLIKFYLKVRKEAELNLSDGLGHKPHFSLRSLCRALNVASKNPCGNIIRSLYEAFCLSFLTQLDLNSYNVVEKMIVSHTVASTQEFKSIMKHNMPKPHGSDKDYMQFEGYWIPLGSLEPSVPEDYILTKSVKKNLKDLVRIVSIGQLPVLLQGDTSVGKTSLITYLAKSSGHKCVRINNHEHTDLQEYVGSYVADANGKLVFREGLLVEAMKKGHWIILDELNLAPSDVLEALNRVLDDNRELFIPETQEVVKAHSNFMLFATQNPPGAYGGRKMLSRAFRNRFIELHFNEIPSDELEIILQQRCHMAPSYAKKMISVMKELQMRRRGSAAFAGKHGFMTLRDLFRWGERYRLAKDKPGLYDWDQHIADEGYLLLAGKVRKQEEKVEIANVITKFMKREVNPESLFTLSNKTSSVTRSILEKIENNKARYPNIVWTFNIRQLAVLLSKALEFHEPALLVGETGCGKTTICDLLAQNNNQKLVTVNCHMHTESSDFIGGLRPVREHNEDPNKLFEWIDGPLIKAMVEGNVFLADEISLADDSVLERLNSLLEPERTLLLAEKGVDINSKKNSELVVAHTEFHFIGTMNPGGDFGKKELSPALRNRFTEIWCEPCNNRDDLINIINHNIKLSAENADMNFGILIMDFIDWFKNEDIGKRFTISVRDILSWVYFINVCCEVVKPADLYLNGACLTFLDSFGSGATSTENDDILKAFKEKCLNFITEQLRKCNLCSKAAVGTEVKIEIKGQLFGIDPFYIEMNSNACEQIPFTFDVPTIKQNTLKLLRSLQLKKPILLEGSPGVGKTSLVIALAKRTGNQIFRVNLSDQTDISDLFGADLPVEGGESGQFAWRDGPLLQALKKGHWILLDELNLASQSVLEGLNACLDHRGEIFIPELGKTFLVKPDTKFFACQNPLKQGGSRRGLPKSFLNRFTQVYISALSNQDYLCILKEQFPQIPTEILEKMVAFNERLTMELKSYTLGTKGGPWEYNLRDLTRWCEVTLYHYGNMLDDKYYAPENSVKLIYSDRLRTPDDKRRILEIFEEVFNCKISGDLTTVYVTKSEVYFGNVRLNREINSCNTNVHKEKETCLVLRDQLTTLRSLAYCVNMNWMSIIVGGSCSGKTSVVRTLAYLVGKTLHTLPVTSAMDTSDLLGGFEQTDYTRHLDDIIKETELLLLKTTQNLFLNKENDRAVDLLKQWRICLTFLAKVNKRRTMTEETALFIKKIENLSNIWRSLRDNETTLKDIKETITKLIERGRVLLDAVKKEGSLNAGGKFEWVDSILIKCLQNGHWLLIDNVNLCSPAVLDRLNALLEPNGTLTITERGVDENGKMIEIRPHKNFRLFLTMDPKNGEISRAMRNRGVEIYLTNEYQNDNNFDVKSLINIKGIVHKAIIGTLLKLHNFISDLIIADKPNIECVLQSAFLISQQLKRGIAIDEAITGTVVDIYYKSRSDYDFNSSDPLSVIKYEIRRNLDDVINKISDRSHDIFDSSVTLQTRELDANTDLTKIKQQVVTIKERLEHPHDIILYYFIMHFYSISSVEDLTLRYVYLNKLIKNDQNVHRINELFYKLLLKLRCDVTHLPVDRKWLPETIYPNIKTSEGNRTTLMFYFTLHKYLNETHTENTSKDGYSLIKYSKNVKSGQIQDSIGDIVVREAVTLLNKCDELFFKIFDDKYVAVNNNEIIEIISVLQWRFRLYQLLTTDITKTKPEELKEVISNLHLHYKWFIKYSVHRVTALVNFKDKVSSKIINAINAELSNCFDILYKFGKRFRKRTIKPPPLTNTTQLSVIPDYHKMADIFTLSKAEDVGRVLTKLTDSNFKTLLIQLKSDLKYEMTDIPDNYEQLKQVFVKFLNETDETRCKKVDLNYLLITDFLSLISMYQTRINNSGSVIDSASIPCTLQGIIKRYQATKDERLSYELVSQITHYLLNNPATSPYKYLKYQDEDNPIVDKVLSWQNPLLTYLFTCILVNSRSKALTFDVDLKNHSHAMELYNKFNRLLWENTSQLSEISCDFIHLEKEYLKAKVKSFFINLAKSLNVDTSNAIPDQMMQLCLDQIIQMKSSLEEEKKVWVSFLGESWKRAHQLTTSSFISDANSIANCYITTSYLNALLNSKLPLIDPFTKIVLRKKQISEEIDNFEILSLSFQRQSQIYSNAEFPLCPIIREQINKLNKQDSELKKEIAVRPQTPKYESLLQDIAHAFVTILSPNKIYTLYTHLETAINCSETWTKSDITNTNDILSQATSFVASIENFITILNQYRCVYPDIIEPFYANIMELEYGLKLKIDLLRKLMLRQQFLKCDSDIQNRLINLMRFPTLNEAQPTINETVDNYMDQTMQDFITTALSANEDSTTKQQKLSLLKCAIQETFNACTTNAKYSQTCATELFNKFNGFIKHFVTVWYKQEDELKKKQAESESLYKVRTKCNDKSEEEQIEDEFNNLFPTYFHEFSDLEQQELGDDQDEPSDEQEFSPISSEDVNFVYNLHAVFLYSHTKSPWLNLNEKHNYLDHITPLMQKYRLFKPLLMECIDALDYSMDTNVLGSLHVLIKVSQKNGNVKLFDEPTSPSRVIMKKTPNFYKDSNVEEIKPCYEILQDLHEKIGEFLIEWPEHPTLKNIITIIERLSNFDITSPISRFLTGFEILLNKCQEWEENAHSGVSIQTHMQNITSQIIIWRKLELSMWRDILNITFHRLNEPIGKWWCYVYQILEQFESEALTAPDLIKTLTKFITESNLAEFENRLELLFIFHCHCAHLKDSPQLQILRNILWNIYHYYKEYIPTIIAKIKDLRTPIEKKLKDYVKIVTWKDISYWAIKETLHKTHKTIHKHIREFEKVLNQSVYPFLCDKGEQNTTYENVGIWDRPQRVSPKSYHYTMDCLTYIAKMNLNKKLQAENADDTLSMKTGKYFRKARSLCKEIISTAQYPKLVKSLDTLVGDIIETSNHLQKLEVDNTLPKNKQKAQAKNILQQKHRSLADLFKLLLKMGVSFKKGILESRIDKTEIRLTTAPIDLDALFSHLSYKRNDEKLLTMWEGCELYYLRSSLRLDLLEETLQNPSKDLGFQNIERCKGFSNNLMTIINEQKQKLITNSERFYYLRYYLTYFTDLCNETNFMHKDIFNDLRNILSHLIILIDQYKILFHTCPDDDFDGTTLNTVPVLKPHIPNALCKKHDATWNKAVTFLSNIMNNAEKILMIMKKNKNIAPSITTSGIVPTFIPIADLDIILKELESTTVMLTDLSRLLGDIPLYSGLKWALKQISDIKNKLVLLNTAEDSVDRYTKNITVQSEKLLEKFLVSFQNIYKKYKNITENQPAEGDTSLEEADSAIDEEHLKNLIMESLFEDLSHLNSNEILKIIETISKNINKLHPQHYPNVIGVINNSLHLFEQFMLLFEYFITQQVSSYRVTTKLSSVLFNIFIELSKKGFCIPPDFSDELDGEGETQKSGGMGLGDGEGEKDVSSRIESEDQLEDAKPENEKQQNEEDKDCKEEDKAIEMSEDFDSKLQDAHRNEDEDNEDESHSDAEEQMGDTEKGADQLDEQIWGSDEEEENEADENEDGTNEEKGNTGKKEGNKELTAKESAPTDKDESPDPNGESENNKNQINEEDPEYDDDQIDPYHGNQPELPEPEPMDLPDDLQLDDNEKGNEEDQDENPFDIDAMKEQMPPENKNENQEQENDDPNVDEKGDESEEDDSNNSENSNKPDALETEKDDTDNQKETAPSDDAMDPEAKEDVEKSEQSTLDETSTHDAQAQPMDVDDTNESADKVDANQAKNQISHEDEPVMQQEDASDKQGVGQSQMEDSSTGHKGLANAQQEAHDTKDDIATQKEKRQTPGESDSKRSLGDTSEPVKKKLKTVNTDDNKEDDVNENRIDETDAEMYQHIKEAKQSSDQVLDVATKEQVEQQKEIPTPKNENSDKAEESSEQLPDEQIEEVCAKDEIKQKAEKFEADKKEKSNKSQHPEGDIIKDPEEMEIDVEGEVIPTLTVPRGTESTHHTQHINLTVDLPAKLNIEDMNNIRLQIEEQLSKWTEVPPTEEAQKTWEKISTLTSNLAQDLSEQLRLVLEPTQASRLRGDFKTGKRINMRKIIPYIASQFRKDKIWLRRTKPAKREYQIVLAIDDSSSMDDNHSKELAFESVALISKALSLLESGQLSVLSFGESTELLHRLDEPFTNQSGYKLLQKFKFDQKKTSVGQMVNFATEMLNGAHTQTNIPNAKLLIVVSDGRGIFSEGETYIKQAIRRATLANVFMIFIIIDNPANNSSILDIRTPVFNRNTTEILSIKSYMDAFPFPFYIILRDINSLPNVLSDALRQWFEVVSNNDRT